MNRVDSTESKELSSSSIPETSKTIPDANDELKKTA